MNKSCKIESPLYGAILLCSLSAFFDILQLLCVVFHCDLVYLDMILYEMTQYIKKRTIQFDLITVFHETTQSIC